ncbi:hypothetical protein ABRY23_13440 [Melioribacteraceae bacterium 4301-Me]|uniref:hypothetical protein n=1 Tax=Pyranulibacter aquaticus TaxID=3163344 RepID=UPI003596BCF4
MNTGQMLITIGAIFLLSLVILRVNATLLTTNNVLDRSKIGLLSVSMATSLIEEATSKSFDENTIAGSVSSTNQLSAVLKAETGEVYPAFDDIDDFNAFRTTPKIDTVYISSSAYIVFQTFCAVDYVSDANPEQVSNQRTWNKRLTVKVTSPAMIDENTAKQDTILLKTVYSYWYFR